MTKYKELNLGHENGIKSVRVEIEYKLERMYLSVNGKEIVARVPTYVKDEQIDKFLRDHIGWINNQMAKFKSDPELAKRDEIVRDIKDGTVIRYLGKEMRVVEDKSISERVVVGEDTIFINPNDYGKFSLETEFVFWWIRTLKKIIDSEANMIYDEIFKPLGIKKPVWHINMGDIKSYWGKCYVEKGEILFNKSLLKTDLEHIKYVVLHEFTHLIFKGHGKDFYGFIEQYMPNCKKLRDVRRRYNPVGFY